MIREGIRWFLDQDLDQEQEMLMGRLPAVPFVKESECWSCM